MPHQHDQHALRQDKRPDRLAHVMQQRRDEQIGIILARGLHRIEHAQAVQLLGPAHPAEQVTLRRGERTRSGIEIYRLSPGQQRPHPLPEA
jgi:hypothetical protein